MSCCGQGRAALKSNPPAFSAPRVPRVGRVGVAAVSRVPAASARVPLRYLGGAPIVVRGAATGAAYVFDARRTVQAVDARDLDGLLRKGIFRRP